MPQRLRLFSRSESCPYWLKSVAHLSLSLSLAGSRGFVDGGENVYPYKNVVEVWLVVVMNVILTLTEKVVEVSVVVVVVVYVVVVVQ